MSGGTFIGSDAARLRVAAQLGRTLAPVCQNIARLSVEMGPAFALVGSVTEPLARLRPILERTFPHGD